MTQVSRIPTLQELTSNKESARILDELNFLLNQTPPKKWIKQHPFVNVKVEGKNVPLDYIPVEKVKQLLIQIFQGYQTEIIGYGALFNAVAVHIRLKVKNPITGEEIIHDGVAAVDVQTKAGASAADLSQINASAVMKALPAAASYALKNAAEKLGSIFGGSMQKHDLSPFMPAYNNELKEAISNDLKNRYNGAGATDK